MSDIFFDDRKRQQLLKPYELKTNTRGREHINRIILPHFASFFKDGDKILSVGRHWKWDYSTFFNNPAKVCDYLVTDIQPEMEPDLVDDIGHSEFATNTFDGIILVGVYDSLIGTIGDEVTAEVHRILKPGGRVLIAWSPTPNGIYSPHQAWPQFIVDEVQYVWGSHFMGENDTDSYGEGDNMGIFIIARNRDDNNRL